MAERAACPAGGTAGGRPAGGRGRAALDATSPRALLLIAALAGGAMPLLAPVLAPAPALAQEAGTADAAQERLLLDADSLAYDETTGTVTATGDVELVYGPRRLRADTVVYTPATGEVVARGNVVLTDPEGNVARAEEAEITEDLREGFIRSLEIMFANRARLSAEAGRREAGQVTTLEDASFTSCNVCPEDPDPLWQIRAGKVVHDQEARVIRYENVVFEVKGVPIAYLPFFSHPDPTVKRKSGFLAPLVGHSSDLGATMEVPYFWAIKPWRDLTFAPLVTSDAGVVARGEYRERFNSGTLTLDGSLTSARETGDNDDVEDDDIRGHIFGEGRFVIDPTWRWGFDLQRATDDTYLDRYEISSQDQLTSRLFAEGFRQRNYAVVDFYSFQGLDEEDDAGETPIVLPYARYSYMGVPDQFGGWWEGGANLLALQRTDGPDSRRLVSNLGYRLPVISRFGERYTFFASLRGDLYHLGDENIHPSNLQRVGGERDNGFESRIVPVVGMDWRYPLLRSGARVQHYLEPIVQVVYSPKNSNPDDLPNEDSLSFEFDETNLFSIDRFPGYDRVETGARANMGVEWSAYWPEGASASVLVGQVLRLEDNQDFNAETGLRDQRSDYVGRIVISPLPFADLIHRFRLDRKDFSFRRNEVMLAGGPAWLRIDLGYVRLEEAPSAQFFGTREEINLTGRLTVTENWRLDAGMRRDLTDDGGMISAEGAIYYSNECVLLGIGLDRDYTRDRDAEPSTSIKLRVVLRNLS